jgi:chromosome partitioning protein
LFNVIITKQKGGVSASTLTREIAVCAAAAGKRVVIVDLDPQRTTSGWWHTRNKNVPGDETPNPGLIDVEHQKLAAILDGLDRAGVVDLVVLDTPPSLHDFVLAIARRCDLALIPCRPTKDDLRAVPPLVNALSGVPIAFLITQVPFRAREYPEVLAALAKTAPVGPPMHFRVGYPRAAEPGGAACEVEGSKEAEEIGAIWQWLETVESSVKDARTAGRKRTKNQGRQENRTP